MCKEISGPNKAFVNEVGKGFNYCEVAGKILAKLMQILTKLFNFCAHLYVTFN